jgi:hypothetical protein
MHRMKHPVAVLLVLLFTSLGSAPAHAGRAGLFLSWHTAAGAPRASESLTLACGGVPRLDTLFMSMDPGESSSGFVGFTAVLRILPLEGDTLSSLWDSPSGTGLPVWMKLEWVRDSTAGAALPFKGNGYGGASCFHTPAGGRIIRMVYAVAAEDSSDIVAGTRYGLARFILRTPGLNPGCRQPVCIEWVTSNLSRIHGRNADVVSGSAVSLNSPAGQGCAPRGADGPAPTTPPPVRR